MDIRIPYWIGKEFLGFNFLTEFETKSFNETLKSRKNKNKGEEPYMCVFAKK